MLDWIPAGSIPRASPVIFATVGGIRWLIGRDSEDVRATPITCRPVITNDFCLSTTEALQLATDRSVPRSHAIRPSHFHYVSTTMMRLITDGNPGSKHLSPGSFRIWHFRIRLANGIILGLELGLGLAGFSFGLAIAKASSVRLSVRHTCDPRLNGSRYRNAFCTIR